MHDLERHVCSFPFSTKVGSHNLPLWGQRPHWLAIHAFEGHICSFLSPTDVGSHNPSLRDPTFLLASHACLGGGMYVPSPPQPRWDLTIYPLEPASSLVSHACLGGACMFVPLLSSGGISRSTPWGQRPIG